MNSGDQRDAGIAGAFADRHSGLCLQDRACGDARGLYSVRKRSPRLTAGGQRCRCRLADFNEGGNAYRVLAC